LHRTTDTHHGTAALKTSASSFARVDDAAEPFVVGVIAMPGDVAPDHPGLFLVGGMAVPFEGEVPQPGELRLCAV
jgi:hypothetical protein